MPEEHASTSGPPTPPGDDSEQFYAPGDGAVRDPRPGSANSGGADGTNGRSLPQIGRYKLLRRIGEGGFGDVYMAEQQIPVQRPVAIKVIKLGMDTEQVIARFDAERQALALMDHPGIARVLDAGATDTGRPYFAMELVKGVAITDYCDTHRLSTRDRLGLFQDVCHAVQHAHQKGVIHRDLKPSNVMVTLTDGAPSVRVIDFGVAKALHQKLTDHTLVTQNRQVIGTPEYMSPEQAEASALDVDTRSDIYSLGVLLYEMLTGARPFETQRLREAGYAEIQRIICEEEPPRPSTRVSALSQATPTDPSSAEKIAERRHTDPRTLARSLRGDLDWIVMRCLEKDRGRRYATASGLAADLGRHLRHEAVLASPPSVGYKLRKYARRNRGALITAGLALSALLVGLTVATIGLVQAWSALEREETARTEAEMVTDQLAEVLAAANPNDLGRDATILEVVERLSASIETKDFPPLVEARLQRVLGETYWALTYFEEAEDHASAAMAIRVRELGAEHPDTLTAEATLGRILQRRGNFALAMQHKKHVLAGRRRVLGEDHPDTLEAMHSMAWLLGDMAHNQEAIDIYTETLDGRRRVLGEQHDDTMRTMGALAFLLKGAERLDDAERMVNKVLPYYRTKLGDDHPLTITSNELMASIHASRGRTTEAIALLREVYESRCRVLGRHHLDTLECIPRLAWLLEKHGPLEEAVLLREENVDGIRAVDNRNTHAVLAMMALVRAYRATERFEDAAEVRKEMVALAPMAEANQDGRALSYIARTVVANPTLDDAAYEDALRIARRASDLASEDGFTMRTLVLAQIRTNRCDEALETLHRWAEAGHEHPLNEILAAMAHHGLGQHDEAANALAPHREAMRDPAYRPTLTISAFGREADMLIGPP